jgi:8-oxo-dGTP diphosphatase
MKQVKVVCAIIISKTPGGEKALFATQRGYGPWKDWWEFPGGKIEAGESPEAALKREIFEELASEIAVERFLTTIEYDYPEFHLSMDSFLCSLVSGRLTLLEHENAAWLSKKDLHSVKWLPADEEILGLLEGLLS